MAGALVVAILGALALLVASMVRRSSDAAKVRAWTAAYDLELTDRNRYTVLSFVELSTTIRVIGGFAGIPVGLLVDDVTGLRTTDGGTWVAWVIGGWTLSALWAGREFRWPPGDGVASLLPRRTADYLPARLRLAPLLPVLVTAGLALSARQRLTTADLAPTPWPATAHLAAVVGLTALIAIATTAAIARTVGRRQPPLHPDVLAADDAIRTNVAHQVAGGGTAVGFVVAARLATSLGTPPAGVGGSAVPFAAVLVLWLAAIVSWRLSTYRAWRVRRDLAGATRRPSLVAP